MSKSPDRYSRSCLNCTSCELRQGGRWCQLLLRFVERYQGRECKAYRATGAVSAGPVVLVTPRKGELRGRVVG
jgi:hypothetical protein